ncbi:ribose 5-phosphate isomerase [Salinicoccus sediminis]|uniref:Ribose 5-phosphate isomerase n=1 Tax=Salinicoccus sediminis TaxID=1432562 RepID=A0A0M2SQB9_9STAP|nr:ribose 5-phosphate isomerase B [Salinicoccus sediminis]KKK35162.1 ribose 5-phosphate isomerase [Salinicoccus sediminis]
MKIVIASDHGGINLKRAIVEALVQKGVDITDFGPDSGESVDYPDYAKPVAEKVADGVFDRGILICGTGIGMSIAANKVKGIRCALVHDSFSAKATRQHNNSNMLAMGERVIGSGLANDIVDIWLNTEYEGGRHERRVCKIEE